MTFVLCKNNRTEEVKKALEGKTMVWFKELMIGKEENLLKDVKSNLSTSPPTYKDDELIEKVILKNYSANILHLKYTGPFTFHQDGTIFKIEPYGEKSIDIKTLENKPSQELPFNYLMALLDVKNTLTLKSKLDNIFKKIPNHFIVKLLITN